MNPVEVNATVLTMKRSCSMILLVVLQFTAVVFAAGDADNFYEMKQGGEQMIAVLEALPYVQEGSGPIMFTFEYSECSYCQGMYRDYNVQSTGLEHRRVFVPVSDRSAKEAAALGKSRKIEDYHAFMNGQKQAPVFNRDNAAIDVFNSIIAGTDRIEAILKQNQWPRRGLVFPQFVWIENGKVFSSAGYEKSDFGKAVARARKGGGTADVWAAFVSNTAAHGVPSAVQASAPLQASGIDIVGLEIGMTQEEVIAALKAHDPRIQFSEWSVKIVAPDSNRQLLEVGSFVNGMTAGLAHGIEGFNYLEEPTEKIVIYFSPPPAEHRVEFIGRELSYPTGKGPDFNITMQSIAQKYGTPTSQRDTAASGLFIQFWQEGGTSLNGQQFVRYSNKSGILAPLNFKAGQYHSVGGPRPPVSDDTIGQSLGIMVNINREGQRVQMMRFMLADDKKTVEQNRAVTWDMGNAALQQHEQKLRGAAQQRQGPKL